MSKEPEQSRGNHCMSKKRYVELQESLQEKFTSEQVTQIMEDVCKVLKFDYNARITTKQRVQKVYEYQKQKAQEQGLTVYELYRKPYRRVNNKQDTLPPKTT